MADTKGTALDNFTMADLATNFDDAIFLPVDTLDTTMDAGGTNKKVLGLTLAQYLGLKPIQAITLTSGAPGEFDFDSIPDYGHRDLELRGNVRGNASGGYEELRVFLNTDVTDANYHSQSNFGSDGNPYATESAKAFGVYVPCTDAPTGYIGSFCVSIPNFLDANNKNLLSTFIDPRTSTFNMVGLSGYRSSVTAPITRVRIQADGWAGGAGDKLFGTVSLYLKF